MIKKVINTDFEGKTLDERYNEAQARIIANVSFMKTQMRDDLAAKIITGICAGDWKFEITEGKTWAKLASAKAYEIADAMIAEREISNV